MYFDWLLAASLFQQPSGYLYLDRLSRSKCSLVNSLSQPILYFQISCKIILTTIVVKSKKSNGSKMDIHTFIRDARMPHGICEMLPPHRLEAPHNTVIHETGAEKKTLHTGTLTPHAENFSAGKWGRASSFISLFRNP